jgi:GNAT superfamily N-acetyltransferase
MFEIRPLQHADVPDVIEMIHALAAFHGDQSTLTAQTLARVALGTSPWVWLHVAEKDGALLGYAALCPMIGLVYARTGMDMQHLYVKQHARGQGVGTALIAACEAFAVSQKCSYLSVGTHPDNATAAKVYQSAGFVQRPPPGPRFGKVL